MAVEFLVDTRPTKKVVVESLTRDVTVRACIFDLIDNAIDAAHQVLRRSGVLDDEDFSQPLIFGGYFVKLHIAGNELTITDNCGGIPAESLRSSVLRFGQRSKQRHGIGVFGVGLNRALFRLGRSSEITSDTGKERTHVELDVATYMSQEEDWNLPATVEASQGASGTTVTIRDLPTSIAVEFSDTAWVDELRREVGQRYTRFLARGFVVEVNAIGAPTSLIEIRENGPLEGEYKYYRTEEGVAVHVQYGQHALHRFSKEPDWNLQQNSKLTKEYGWTVFCNDRAILIADQTWKTGWDTKFHSEFYGFVGVVQFIAEDTSLLPWNTTKSDVDMNNPAYGVALRDMRHFAGKWRGFADRRKRDKGPLLPLPPLPPGTTRSVPPAPIAKVPNPPARRKVVSKQDHNQYRTVLPGDVNEHLCNDKQLALVHSAKKLDLVDHTYVGLALMRMLFETSVILHFDRKSEFGLLLTNSVQIREKKWGRVLTPGERKAMMPTFDEVVSYLENNPAVWGAARESSLKHSLKRVASHQGLLNGALHNAFATINAHNALMVRDEIIPMLRHLIET